MQLACATKIMLNKNTQLKTILYLNENILLSMRPV